MNELPLPKKSRVGESRWEGYVHWLHKNHLISLLQTDRDEYDDVFHVWHTYHINYLTGTSIWKIEKPEIEVPYCMGTHIKVNGKFIAIKCSKPNRRKGGSDFRLDKFRHAGCNEHTWRIRGNICVKCGRGKGDDFVFCTNCSHLKTDIPIMICDDERCGDCMDRKTKMLNYQKSQMSSFHSY